ncbi:MAG TPA: FecR domain-containing protein [Chryseosolibacter sp.]
MKDEENDIREIITRHFAGETSAAEEKALSEWIGQSAENDAEYRRSKKLFAAATRHYKKTIVPDIDVDAEWKVFEQKVSDGKPVINLRPSFSMLKIAAAVLLLIAAGATIYFYANRAEAVYFETASLVRKVELPDGSTVVLNRFSRLEYTSDFGNDHRNVKLQGEAFFDVTRNAALPFVISARNTTIEVVGTSFNVLAYDSISEVGVIVQSGVVRFTVPELNKTVELMAGEKGTFASAQKTVQEEVNQDVNYQSWNTRKLTFNETHLSAVIEAINKAYNTNIVLKGIVSDTCLLTASFDNQSLEAVLNVLESTLNLTYERVGNRIEITSTGC